MRHPARWRHCLQEGQSPAAIYSQTGPDAMFWRDEARNRGAKPLLTWLETRLLCRETLPGVRFRVLLAERCDGRGCGQRERGDAACREMHDEGAFGGAVFESAAMVEPRVGAERRVGLAKFGGYLDAIGAERDIRSGGGDRHAAMAGEQVFGAIGVGRGSGRGEKGSGSERGQQKEMRAEFHGGTCGLNGDGKRRDDGSLCAATSRSEAMRVNGSPAQRNAVATE